VDGLRAFAALWVVFLPHAGVQWWKVAAGPGHRRPQRLDRREPLPGAQRILLYVPYAGGRSDRFKDEDLSKASLVASGAAYYASLVLVVVAIAVTGGRDGLPRLSASSLAQQLVAHLAIVQQFFPSTFYGLNGAYWSLGLEWEFYLTLPLLIWAARRWGVGRTVAAVVGVNVLYGWLWPPSSRTGSRPPTAPSPPMSCRISSRAMGRVRLRHAGRRAVHDGTGAPMGKETTVGILGLVRWAWRSQGSISHLIFGLVFFIVLCLVLADDNVVARVFSWTPGVVLGTMSYSIYLMHTPVLEIIDGVLKGRGASPNTVLLGMIALLPVVLILSWLCS